MADEKRSLLAGRNAQPLTDGEIRRVAATFLGMDDRVPARYDADQPTCFRVAHDDDGHEYGEIRFGVDIYPGRSIVDPNSALSVQAAAAHELTHYHRWHNKAELPENELLHLDEALTSLEAILRYERHLQSSDVRQLVSDAIQRIHFFLRR
jgi:hypothetical protein